MLKKIQLGVFGMTLALVSLGATASLAQQSETEKSAGDKQKSAATQAPVPAQILSAKKIFIAYGGGETNRPPQNYSGSADRTYSQFYMALNNWSNYQLVSTPAEADLVFEVSFANPYVGGSVFGGGAINGTSGGVSSVSYTDPQLKVAIIDLKTHVVLWTLIEHVEFARLQGNRDKNFDRAIAALVNDIARLAGKPSATASAGKKDNNDPEGNE